MSEKQIGKHWKVDSSKAKGVHKREINSFQIDKEIVRKRDRLPDPDVKGEIGSNEWWKNLRKERKEIKSQIKEMKRVRGGGDRYIENLRRWTELLLRLDKMVGDATGVFFKDSNKVNTGDVTNFIVVMPDQHLESNKIENVAVEILEESNEDDEEDEDE